MGATQTQDGRDRYGPGRCAECGCALVETHRQTMSSPAEYDCPACAMGVEEYEEMRRVESWGPEERN